MRSFIVPSVNPLKRSPRHDIEKRILRRLAKGEFAGSGRKLAQSIKADPSSVRYALKKLEELGKMVPITVDPTVGPADRQVAADRCKRSPAVAVRVLSVARPDGPEEDSGIEPRRLVAGDGQLEFLLEPFGGQGQVARCATPFELAFTQ